MNKERLLLSVLLTVQHYPSNTRLQRRKNDLEHSVVLEHPNKTANVWHSALCHPNCAASAIDEARSYTRPVQLIVPSI